MKSLQFSLHQRKASVDRLQTEEFDLVIIGGGITGAGTARDAASRGMKVALIEARDFAEGTSSRSSKLIHGGIRYLENLEFGLVFEALSERRLLFEIAPQLVHPLRFILPLYRNSRVGMAKMGAGMWLYDALSMFEAPALHERLSADESLEHLPQLESQDLVGSYVYSDAYMDDARLVIETLRSAVAQNAVCVSYMKAGETEFQNGKIKAIYAEDQLSKEKFKIRGKHFISSVGPWTDILATEMFRNWNPILRPSKGIHLTFDRNRWPIHDAVVMAADSEKRIVFGIPRNEMLILGTTDTDYEGDPANVSVTNDDVNYLLGVASQYFPGANLTVSDVIASYAGVRPLVEDGAETESKTSREHVILQDPRNITFVAGGKYTTYRLMAEQTVEAALENFSLDQQVRFGRNQTKVALNPLATTDKMFEASQLATSWTKEFGLSQQAIQLLVERHGMEAEVILDEGRDILSWFNTEPEKLWGLEARHSIRQTMCFRLVDFYARRTPLFLSMRDHGLGVLRAVGLVFAGELGWSDTKRHEEWGTVNAYIEKELAWKSRIRR